MFQKLKQIKDLRSQAKTMQDALATESVTNEKSGITISLNGNLEFTRISIADGLTKAQIEKAFMESANEAIQKAQKLIAKKMQEMGGLSKLGL